MPHKPWPFPPIIILALISIVGIGGAFFYFYPSQELLNASNDYSGSATAKYINGLDGEPADTEANLQVVGVMIDNHPDARPGSGVSKAKIVYEAPVEGGITRYMVIFDSRQDISEIGPVRSARSYFLDWLQEYGNGLYVHSGGSPEALGLIKSRKIFDGDEFGWGRYFWRSTKKFAPHNLYTDSENLGEIISLRGNTSSLFTADKAWQYSRILGVTISTSSLLKIPYNRNYLVAWEYDAKELKYSRTVNGDTEADRDGTQVTARNILVQITSVQGIENDDKGRKGVVTVGDGEAIILKKGSVVYGTWKKPSLTGRTRFYDGDGKEVTLAPGNTWVQVVPREVMMQVSN